MTERVFMNRSSRMQRWRKGAILVLSALILLALALLVAACRGKAPDPAATQAQSALSGPAAAVKLMVEADGIYTVPAAALRSAGFDLTTVSPEALALTHAGRPVAFQVVGQGKNRALRFYGQAPAPTAYTGQSVYWLAPTSAGAAGPAAIAVRSAAPAGAAAGVTPTTVVSATVRAEEQKHYDGMAAAAEDHWLWQSIFAPAEIQAPDPGAARGRGRGHAAGPPGRQFLRARRS